MRKTLERDRDRKNNLTVNADTLASMLDCGRATAVKIGIDAEREYRLGGGHCTKFQSLKNIWKDYLASK